MEHQRCLEVFLQAIAPTTQKNYKINLDKFLKWNKLTDYDDLLKADEKSIQRNLRLIQTDLESFHLTSMALTYFIYKMDSIGSMVHGSKED